MTIHLQPVVVILCVLHVALVPFIRPSAIMRSSILSLTAFVFLVAQPIAAFAPPSALSNHHHQMPAAATGAAAVMVRSPLFASSVSLPKLFSSANGASDPVIREFEKKETEYRKRYEDAAARLNKYESSLELLQSKKAEYMAGQQMAEPPVGGSFRETTLRSAVKAFCWRIVAGSVTFITTLKFSGSVSQALQVVGADFFSKAFTMFIGERLMNRSQAGRKKGGDAASRSLAKALIWRVFAIANTLTMAIFISKDLSVASKIASTDAVFKTALMFFYERLWARINWGKEYLIEFAI